MRDFAIELSENSIQYFLIPYFLLHYAQDFAIELSNLYEEKLYGVDTDL